MAATLTLRSVKGSPLTNNEVDGNFTALNTEIGTLETDVSTAQTDISTLQTDVTALESTVGSGNLNETIQDVVGAMVTSNTESGISVTYQDGDNTLDFNVNDPTISLTGDATGSGTMTNLGNVSIAVDVSSITGNLSVTGDVTAVNFNATSDAALKENLSIIDSPLEKLSLLNGYTFNWIDNKREAVGIVAQEVEKVFPQIVSTSEDGLKRVSYDSLIPLLIESIKDLKNQLDNRWIINK